MISENITVAIVVSIAPTLAVIGSTLISLKSTRKQDVKLDEIHTLTNDNFSKANEKIDRLEKIISDQKRQALKKAKGG